MLVQAYIGLLSAKLVSEERVVERVLKMKTLRYFIIIGFVVATVLCQSAMADVIIDNGAAGTSSTGTWQVSGSLVHMAQILSGVIGELHIHGRLLQQAQESTEYRCGGRHYLPGIKVCR